MISVAEESVDVYVTLVTVMGPDATVQNPVLGYS